MPTLKELLSEAWKLREERQPQRAESIYRHVLRQLPNHASAWFYLGIVLHDQRRCGDAIEAYRNALHHRPDFPSALNNLGNALRDDYQTEEADRSYEAALKLKPDYAHAHKNRGILRAFSGDFETARACYENALQLAPDDAEAHRNLGLLYLRQGDFQRGWAEYNWRWKCNDLVRPGYAQPIWTGQPLAGKTLLLYAEQGLGDAIHFVRFVRHVKRLTARTIVHGPAALSELLGFCEGIDQWIPSTQSVDVPFDYHCSFMEVAAQFVSHVSDIPVVGRYIQPATHLVERWGSWLGQLPSGKRRVGIAWQGGQHYPSDRLRSAPLSIFEPWGDIDSIQLISLQRGYGSEQLSEWRGRNSIVSLPDEIDTCNGSFMDTAAILQGIDLIVTVDTSIGHLAGAMGRPTWLLLNFVPDWRWLIGRIDSPWYPATKLIRQSAPGDWHGIVSQLATGFARLPKPTC